MTLSSLRWLLPMVALISLLSACSHYIYGVPQDHWRVMSESERTEVIRLYQERRVQEERRRAAEAEVRAMEMDKRQRTYPELIHLHLGEGSFFYRGRSYRYQSQTFQLKYGETRTLQLVTVEGHLSHKVLLRLRYAQGRVMLGDDKRFSHVIDYRDSWERGEHYAGISLQGALQLKGIELDIGVNPFVFPVMREHGEDSAPNLELSQHARPGQENSERERAEREKTKRERAERERAEREKTKRERAEREKTKREKTEREKTEREKTEREKTEREKTEREKTKREKTEREKTEREKTEREKAEREKTEREKAERMPPRRERNGQEKIQTKSSPQEMHGRPSVPAEPDGCNGNRGNGDNRNPRSPDCN